MSGDGSGAVLGFNVLGSSHIAKTLRDAIWQAVADVLLSVNWGGAVHTYAGSDGVLSSLACATGRAAPEAMALGLSLLVAIAVLAVAAVLVVTSHRSSSTSSGSYSRSRSR